MIQISLKTLEVLFHPTDRNNQLVDDPFLRGEFHAMGNFRKKLD